MCPHRKRRTLGCPCREVISVKWSKAFTVRLVRITHIFVSFFVIRKYVEVDESRNNIVVDDNDNKKNEMYLDRLGDDD